MEPTVTFTPGLDPAASGDLSGPGCHRRLPIHLPGFLRAVRNGRQSPEMAHRLDVFAGGLPSANRRILHPNGLKFTWHEKLNEHKVLRSIAFKVVMLALVVINDITFAIGVAVRWCTQCPRPKSHTENAPHPRDSG